MLRIVGGRLRGRVLEVPSSQLSRPRRRSGKATASADGQEVRPTTDRVRESVFSILEHRFAGRDGFRLAGARVLDLFAGSGALGFEALSRGAAYSLFCEQNPGYCTALRRTAAALGLEEVSAVVRADALTLTPQQAQSAALGGGQAVAESRRLDITNCFDLVFLDPPYGQSLVAPAVDQLRMTGLAQSGCLLYVEVGAGEPLPELDGCALVDDRRYGRIRIGFYAVI